MPFSDPATRRQYQEDRRAKRRAERELLEGPIRRGRPPQAISAREQARVEDKRSVTTLRLPMQMLGRMVRLKDEGVATGKYPWRTLSAVAEAMILRGFESMVGDPIVDEMLPYLRAMGQIDGIAGHRKEAQAALSRFKVEIAELLRIRATQEATQYFHAVYYEFTQMSPNVWRDWALTEMRRAFPALAKATPKRVAVRGTDRRQDIKRKTPIRSERS